MISMSIKKIRTKNANVFKYNTITNVKNVFLMIYPYYQVKSKFLLMDKRYYDVREILCDIIDDIIYDCLEIDKTTGIPIASFLAVGKFLYEKN